MCFLLRTGFRLAEVAAHSSGEIRYLTRSNLTAVVKGRPQADPPPDVLRSMSTGDYFLVTPPRSKTDEWGEVHCPFPCTLMYADDPLNPARRLRDAELRAPCRGDARATTPLFARPVGVLLTYAFVDGPHSLKRPRVHHRTGGGRQVLVALVPYRIGLRAESGGVPARRRAAHLPLDVR